MDTKIKGLIHSIIPTRSSSTVALALVIRELKHQTFLVPRTPTGSIFCSMTATGHATMFLSCGYGLQNASSQVETRGSNSGFFEEYLSEIMFFFVRKKQNFTQIFERHFQMNYSVGVRDGFTLVCLMIAFGA